MIPLTSVGTSRQKAHVKKTNYRRQKAHVNKTNYTRQKEQVNKTNYTRQKGHVIKDRTHNATLRATLRAMGWTHGAIVAEVELASTPATLRAILHAMLHRVSGP